MTRGTIPVHNINLDGACEGQQRSLEGFQFDFEIVLTLSQLVGKSAEERNAASVKLDILASTNEKTTAKVACAAILSLIHI